MRTRVLLYVASAFGVCLINAHDAAAESPSFDCGKARLPDEIVIRRTPELAQLVNVVAAAYA